MGRINPKYVLPDPSYGEKARKRYSLLCDRIEGDAGSLAINVHKCITKIFDAEIYELEDADYEERQKYRGTLEGIEKIAELIASQIPQFATALSQLGSQMDETRVKNAQAYCAYVKTALQQFRSLPFYNEIFEKGSKF